MIRRHKSSTAQSAGRSKLIRVTCVSQGQSAIVWDEPLTISADSDVSTEGLLVDAVNNSADGVFSVTVNGVLFKQLTREILTLIRSRRVTLP